MQTYKHYISGNLPQTQPKTEGNYPYSKETQVY